ncbi:RluA family pseudouridine synthase [Limosilactobacillus sp. STM2_1]|uniref:Pseudouridine synthase n=1 Tax=Limosilactobacillus rudii TaxID=2759755 RepID=A0A7W3YMM2_9LACO|nr:RluA family pseudouridine synthase [Limosilactobacillus rudii]MBB1078517.1 RluA family pseudouridine synthase [Limosilactobacillus rudii]MBB1096646.1 RluA family pseudouridine synthase [Limosilactobacillus rudii]MCD7133679.1 RluA family pseudouridine synthase [Limosilactobacillus rudii]
MEFTWIYDHQTSRKLRAALKMYGVSSSLLKVAIYHGGKMKINGEDKWAVDQVHYLDKITLVLPPEVANDNVDISNAPIDIVYEDQDFLIMNKPAGVATVPAHNVEVADSLVNRVRGYYKKQNYENQVTHVATRLDRDTSGLVIFPKHRFAHAVLDTQLKKHLVKKNYLALVHGNVPAQHGYIDAPIKRDPTSFVKRIVGKGGKASVTEYWSEASNSRASLVKIRLHTGRTHQIRVHFAEIGFPLIGDRMYGESSDIISRQALHCYWLSFYSPFQRKNITVSAPLPNDFQDAVNYYIKG